jgi:hypothetical protein
MAREIEVTHEGDENRFTFSKLSREPIYQKQISILSQPRAN